MRTRFYDLTRLTIVFFLLLHSLSLAQFGLHGELQLASNKAIALQDQPLHFFNGVISSEGENAQLLFLGSAQALNASEAAYSEVEVSIAGQDNFIFPLGKQGRYLPLQLREGNTAALQAQLKIGPPLNQSLATGIDQLIPSHHWQLSGGKIAVVQLSWDQNTQLDALVEQVEDLLLLGFNGDQWESLPALLTPFAIGTNNPTSLSQGGIESKERIDFSRYTALAIGSRSSNSALQISQAITPNGDGINDVWFIDNIDRYPNAKIWVYSRWGNEVFYSPGNYRNNWNATFKNNTKSLPEAPYFYRVDQDNDGTIDLEGWLYITR